MDKKLLTIGLVFTMIFSSLIVAGKGTNFSPDSKGNQTISTPSISFAYSSEHNWVWVTAADPGYHYSSSSSPSGANLVFMKNNVTYYVLENFTVGASGVLSTDEIVASQVIQGFSAGSYSIVWLPTGDSLLVFNVSEGGTPSISFSYDSSNDRVTVTSVDPGYYYSDYPGSSGANLVFVKDNVTYYVLQNYTVGFGLLLTAEIQPGDTIHGFSTGSYQIVWKDSGFVFFTFTVVNGSVPSISFSYSDVSKRLTITSVDPGFYYSDGQSHSDANLVFAKHNYSGYYYVLENFTIGASGVLSTDEISPGDVISGFSAGIYYAVWQPTGAVLYWFTVTDSGSAPSINFSYDDVLKRVTITSAEPGYYYSESQNTSDANLVFVKNNVTYYVLSGFIIGTSGVLLTQEIVDGEYIHGFSAGTYQIVWRPTNTVLFTFTVTIGSTPAMNFTYNDVNKRLTVGFAEPGYYYSDGPSPIDANFVFAKHNATNYFYVLENFTVGATGVLLTDEIQSGDEIHGFSAGIWYVVWAPSGAMMFTFTVSSPDENRTLVNEAIDTGQVGGEITVWQKDNKTYDHEISIYNGVNITKLDIEKGAVSFTVSGNENSTGKTIGINIVEGVFNSISDIRVNYDGKAIQMADDINDVLNPNDDGSNPEYLITVGANGTQILVSIPHFSEHEITVYGLAEEAAGALGGVTAVLAYVAICLIAAVLFVCAVYIRRRI